VRIPLGNIKAITSFKEVKIITKLVSIGNWNLYHVSTLFLAGLQKYNLNIIAI
jgi:hypothetical protein